MRQKKHWTGNEETEWSQDAAVARAMERLTPWVGTHDEKEVETILRLLWDDGASWGYNFG